MIGYSGLSEFGTFSSLEEATLVAQRIYTEGLPGGAPGTNNLAIHQLGGTNSSFRGTATPMGSIDSATTLGITSPAEQAGEGGIVAKLNGPCGWTVEKFTKTVTGSSTIRPENEVAIMRQQPAEFIEQLYYITRSKTTFDQKVVPIPRPK